MKKLALGLVVLMGGAGCVVQSLNPWLSAETRVAEPGLLVQKQNEISRCTANRHRTDDTLLPVVGPQERQDLGRYAARPGHLLSKAVLDGAALKLYGVELESLEARAATSGMSFLPVGSANEHPSVLIGTTAEAEAFVRAQLADPEFFDEAPLYSFQKLPAAGPWEDFHILYLTYVIINICSWA